MLSAEAVADVDAEMKCGRDCTIWAAPLSFSTISPLVQSASPLFILPAFAHQSAAEHLKHAAAAITTTPTRLLLHRKHAVLRVLPCSIRRSFQSQRELGSRSPGTIHESNTEAWFKDINI
jgi:hypothetical protein